MRPDSKALQRKASPAADDAQAVTPSSKQSPVVPRNVWARLQTRLTAPVNGASLATFRIALGTVMALEAYSLLRPNVAAITSGLTPLQTYYTGPNISFHFSFEGFEWLPLLPPRWIYALVALQALAGLTSALGLWYRLSAATVFLTWGYLFAVESTRTYWQSHYYLELLLTFLMIWLPANRRYSLDAWFARRRPLPTTVPFWSIALLRGQLVIAYFYAGVAKLNADWLLDAVPVRWILAQPDLISRYEAHLSPGQIEFLKGVLHSVGFAYFISYAGALFDLSVGFLLLFRRTRIFAMVLMVLFHATNHFILFEDIGWFPLVGITTAFIFLEPDWPERLLNRFRVRKSAQPERQKRRKSRGGQPSGASPSGQPAASRSSPAIASPPTGIRAPALFVLLWLLCQALLPIRHFLIPADSRFTYEAQSFSWRLKADVRRASPAELFVEDPLIIPRIPLPPFGSAAAAPALKADQAVPQIHWDQWRGERVIYRRVTTGRIEWERLPEIIVLLEPVIGERVIYSPLAGPGVIRTEAEARERVRSIWQSRYGRQPQTIRSTSSLSRFLRSVAEGLHAGGNSPEAAELDRLASHTREMENSQPPKEVASHTPPGLLDLLLNFRARDKVGEMTPFFRSLAPFALVGEPLKAAPFLVIEDPLLLSSGRHSGAEPLIIYTTDLGQEVKELLPQACISDSLDHPEQPPAIWWNSPRDLTASKLMHISTQPFYLRRYARRVAEIWQKEYGHRPAVRAVTSMSLNGRPSQLLVDPTVDLATARVAWFKHNSWIKNLETPRIPRSAVEEGSGFKSP